MKPIAPADVEAVLRVIRYGTRNDLRYASQRAIYDYLTSLPTPVREYEPQLYSNVLAAMPRVWGGQGR